MENTYQIIIKKYPELKALVPGEFKSIKDIGKCVDAYVLPDTKSRSELFDCNWHLPTVAQAHNERNPKPHNSLREFFINAVDTVRYFIGDLLEFPNENDIDVRLISPAENVLFRMKLNNTTHQVKGLSQYIRQEKYPTKAWQKTDFSNHVFEELILN